MHLGPYTWKLMYLVLALSCGNDEVPDNVTPHPIVFVSKSLSSAGQWYNNIEWESLSTLNSLDRFHYYCFAKEVNVIMDHKPLVVIISKDAAMLSQC